MLRPVTKTPNLVLAAILLGCLMPAGAQASSLEISPVTVNLAPGQNVTTVEVTNRGDASAAIQIRAYGWNQAGNEDVLTPTQDIIVSPPIFTVSKGSSQTVRMLLRGGIATRERNYRLLIDEVPPANIHNQQVAIAMRVSLPVIAASAQALPPKLQWRATRGTGHQILLSATNDGTSYDKVHAIVVTLADGSHPIVKASGNNPYILPGAQRHWVVADGGAAPIALRLAVTSQSGKNEHSLALSR